MRQESQRTRVPASKHGCKQGFGKIKCLQIFYEDGIALDMCVEETIGCTYCVLVTRTDCEHNFCMFTRRVHKAPLTQAHFQAGYITMVTYDAARLT